MSGVWNNNLFELIETNIDELPFKISNFSLFLALKSVDNHFKFLDFYGLLIES